MNPALFLIQAGFKLFGVCVLFIKVFDVYIIKPVFVIIL